VVIEGQVPEELLGGMYLRNGPNPPFKPEGGYHWYEGDGMIHACWLKGPAEAVYSNQYVQTLRLQEEQRQQGKVFLRVGGALRRASSPQPRSRAVLQRLAPEVAWCTPAQPAQPRRACLPVPARCATCAASAASSRSPPPSSPRR
jgi:hypothetical protein